MSILKLKNAGDEATITIRALEEVQGQYGEQIKLTSDAGDDLYIPKDSFERQLEHLGIDDSSTVVGQALTISRVPSKKPGVNYWNINTAKKQNGATKPQTAPPKSIANKPNSDLPPLLQNAEAEDNAELAAKIGVDLSGIQKQLATYQAVAEWTVKTLPPIFNAGKDAVGMTPESLAACTNTIFINAAKK